MRKICTAALCLILSACASSPGYKVYPIGERVIIKSGYSDNGRRAVGNEFVFSLVLPEDEWSYYADSRGPSMGYLSVYGENTRKNLMIEWLWLNKNREETKETIENSPFYFPWYSGIKGDGSRMFHTPTEKQLRYGDWHQNGYPQRQFRQIVYRGKKPFYCVRSVIRRGPSSPWQKEYTQEYLRQVRPGLYEVYDTCPFRTTDNRDAYFKISAAFNVSAEGIAANPAIVDDNLKAMDEWIKPLWDSLEIMPKAYQFEPPSAQ